MNLKDIFDARDVENGPFTQFYEDLCVLLESISDYEISCKIETIWKLTGNRIYSDKLKVLYDYSRLPLSPDKNLPK